MLTEIVEGELIKRAQIESLPSASSRLLVDTGIGNEESGKRNVRNGSSAAIFVRKYKQNRLGVSHKVTGGFKEC